MPFWEENRYLMAVAGSFLLLWLLLYIFILGPNAGEIAQLNKLREEQIGKDIKVFFGEGITIDFLKREYVQSNKHLQQRFDKLKGNISRPFTEDLLPADKQEFRQAYTRETLERLQNEISRSAGSRKVRLSGKSLTLGLVLPSEYTESIETDISWLEQMHAARELAQLILLLSEEKDGTRNILSVAEIQPFAAINAGSQLSFIREFPLQIRLVVSLRGVIRLLYAFSQPQTFYLVEEIKIVSDSGKRQSILHTSKPKVIKSGVNLVKKRNEFYYEVKLKIARVAVVSPELAIAPVEKKTEEVKPKQPMAY